MGRRRTARGALLNQVLVLFVVAAVAAVIALMALRVGAAPLGTSAPDDASACLQQAAPSSDGALASGPTEPVSVERTWIPLGLICTTKSLDGSGAPLVVTHQSWPATITVVVATLIAIAGVLRLVTLLRLFARTGRVFA